MPVRLDLDPLATWGPPPGELFLVAGPCSAESETQLVSTALAIAPLGVHLLRAGIWKPRTRPHCFEGVGAPGLAWLKEAGRQSGLRVTAEVACPEHVEQCLRHGVDVLWVGARTSANPFSVQAIADALRGVDIPVMVKNPVNPDLDLWIGALERLHSRGLRKLAAIHRGFSSFRETGYRNAPNWKLPIELKRRVPALPLLCDPSHICGDREGIAAVSQKALDLLYDGLMIEAHIDPDAALSDARQQLRPEALGGLLASLRRNRGELPDLAAPPRLEELRRQIDDLDASLLDLLARRMAVSDALGEVKQSLGLSILQPGRWSEIVASRGRQARALGLDEAFVLSLFERIHEEAIRRQGR